ncbi:MAG: hypothetical protein EKK61_06310 [Rickettsiales bacterium]|nr:MAG: hypothetical protein EKK61_06310 [Rickettsiales bacterium]
MELTEEIIQFVKTNNCQFVSLKYLGEDGILNQIDFSANNISALKNIFEQKNIDLVPIKNKFFQDPFRSASTLTVFCTNYAIARLRNEIERINSFEHLKNITNINTEISFWIIDDINNHNNIQYVADPIDLGANLRAEIVQCLENIGISTTIHYHGKTEHEYIVGIQGNSLLDLADNITITHFIINNCATSYGKKVIFNQENNSNLSLIICYDCNNKENFHSLVATRLDKVFSCSDSFSQFKFEIKRYTDYSNKDKLCFNIEILTHEYYLPYYLLIRVFNEQ